MKKEALSTALVMDFDRILPQLADRRISESVSIRMIMDTLTESKQ